MGCVRIKSIDIKKALKAYNCFAGDYPGQNGCLLVFHYTRNQARLLACGIFDSEYIYTRARRAPAMDQYCNINIVGREWAGSVPWFADSNDDLPPGVEFYADRDNDHYF